MPVYGDSSADAAAISSGPPPLLPAAEPAASRPFSAEGCASGDRHLGFDQEWLAAVGFGVWFCPAFVFSFPVQSWLHCLYLKTLVLAMRV